MSRRYEQLLFRYSSALERGDFQTVAEVLRDAERHPVLEQMILDMNAAYTADSLVNHKNSEEIPMVAALYQKPAPKQASWQSLPLVAALVVIGVLVVLLALQTRSNKDLNTGQGGSPAAAQAKALCQGTSRASVNLYSHPSNTSVIVGTLASDTVVNVLDEQLASDGNQWILWFFVAANGVQGWTLSDAVAGSGCPQIQENFVPPAITAQQSVMTLVPSYASATPPSANIAVTALPATIPAGITANQQTTTSATACPASGDAAAPRITMYSRPSLDAYKFSQSYDAAQYAFFLLDSTDVDGQTWYYVRIDSAIDEKQGWITGSDYGMIKDCAPWNAAQTSIAIPSASFSAVPPTLVPMNASPVPTEAMLILDTCLFDLPKAVALYAEPSDDARAIDFLHKGTSIEVSEPSPLWYWVTAHYSDGMPSNTGFVRADMLTLPDDCHLTPAGNASVIPATLLPADGIPIPVVPTIAAANAIPIPNVSAAAIPVSPEVSPAAPLCYFHTSDPVAIRGSMDLLAPIIAMLPAGIDLQLIDYEAAQNGLWLLVSTRVGDITISRAWIRGDDVNVSLQCPGVIQSSSDALPTATPIS